jgi:tetratricopeptide (TPR) repeat protein
MLKRTLILLILPALIAGCAVFRGGGDDPGGEVQSVSADDQAVREVLAHGRELMRERKLDQALVWFTEAMDEHPDHYVLHYSRGWVFLALDENEFAQRDFSRALTLQPDFALSYKGRSLAWERLGALDAAIEDLRLYLESEPTDLDARHRLWELEETAGAR